VNLAYSLSLRKNISAYAENQGILDASSIGSADGKKSINVFYWNMANYPRQMQ
jgi:hypothetical protein